MAKFILKIAAGIGGGAVGSLVLVLLLFAANALLGAANVNDGSGTVAVSAFFVMIVVFIAGTLANMAAVWFIALTDRARYGRLGKVMYQVLFVSVAVFLLMIPVYFLAGKENLFMAVGFHVLLKALLSATILEMVADPRKSLVALYGFVLALLLGLMMMALLGKAINGQLLWLVSLPIVWALTSFASGLVKGVYDGLSGVYEKDFLDLDGQE